MIEQNRQVIEEYEPADNVKIQISVTYDETRVYLDVLYLEGKFTIQRNYPNNYIGLQNLEEDKQEFETEEQVKKYFGLK